MPNPFIKIQESRNGSVSTISTMMHFEVGVMKVEVIVSPMFCLHIIDIMKRNVSAIASINGNRGKCS